MFCVLQPVMVIFKSEERLGVCLEKNSRKTPPHSTPRLDGISRNNIPILAILLSFESPKLCSKSFLLLRPHTLFQRNVKSQNFMNFAVNLMGIWDQLRAPLLVCRSYRRIARQSALPIYSRPISTIADSAKWSPFYQTYFSLSCGIILCLSGCL